MTKKTPGKRAARLLQKETGRSYQQCLTFVRKLYVIEGPRYSIRLNMDAVIKLLGEVHPRKETE